MTEDRRTVVEGVEFAQLFQFPKILRAIPAAFQPPRLVLGLLIVAALMTVGRVWDAFAPARVGPAGLTAAPWDSEQEQQAQLTLAAALDRYNVGAADRPEGELDAHEVANLVRAAYRGQRETQAGGPRTQRLKDEAYLATLEEIDQARPRGIFTATVSHVAGSFNRMIRGLATLRLEDFFGGIRDLFVTTPVSLWEHSWLFTLVYGAFFVILMAVGGGAICRMTAVEIAHGEKLRLQEALDFSVRGWRRLCMSLILPLLIAAFLCALLLVGGFFLMLPWVEVLGGLLYGIALLLGFGVVFLLVGYALGFSLLVPAVACENCDAADAQQRAYAYVLSRPLHLLGYLVVCFAGLALGFVVASLFAVAVLNVTGRLVDAVTANAAVSIAHGFDLFDLSPRREAAIPLQTLSAASASLVMFWQTVVVCLVAGYVFSYYFGASTIMYLLMRRACDGQEVDEIWEPGAVPGTMADEPEDLEDLDEEEPEPEPDPQGASEEER